MNTVMLNTVHLDGAPIIKKGSGEGGGVTINNQSKSVEIVENGTSEVRYDAGYTGLEKVSVKVAIPNEEKSVDITENGTTEVVADSGFLNKVTVNVNVPSSGGGTTPDMPVIGDGKTYLYIKIAAKGRMDVPLYFSQTVANGVTIDWGDGSATQTLSGTGNVNTTHTYAEIGEYTISLNPDSGCTLGLGHALTSYCVMGYASDSGLVYCNMLQAVEIGKNVTSIDKGAFYYCRSLASVVIPNSVTKIGESAFYYCHSLTSIVIPSSVTSIIRSAFYGCSSLTSVVISDGVTSIGDSMFNNCSSLASVVIPNSVTKIGESAFYYCYSLASVVIPSSVTSIKNTAFNTCLGMAFYDFRASESVPTLGGTSVFGSIPSDCKIVVPDDLYDTWIVATNWSTHASKIIKASEFNG